MGKWLDKDGLITFWNLVKGKLDRKVEIVDGKGLSTNDYSDEDKAKLESIASGANNYVLPQASGEALGGIKLGEGLVIDGSGKVSVHDVTASAVAWSNVNDKPNSLAGYGISDAVSLNDFNSFKGTVSGAYKYCGTVMTIDALQNIEDPENGNVYNVEANGMNYAWNEDEGKWDELGANIDLSDYAKTEDFADVARLGDLNDFVTTNDISDFVTENELNDYIKTEDLDLSPYAKTEELDNYAKSSDLDVYLKTEDLDLTDYVKSSDIVALDEYDLDLITGTASTPQSFAKLLADGEDIELGSSLTLNEPVAIEGNVTINLMGKSITSNASDTLFSVNGGSLTLKGSGVINTVKGIATAYNGGEIIIENGTYVSSVDGAFHAVGNNSKITMESGSVTGREGGLGAFDGAAIEMNGGTVSGTDNFAIFTNGTAGRGGNTIIMNGGKLVGNIVSEGYEAIGVYIANNDTFIMNDGEIIANGGAGLCMRAGTVEINGGKIIAKESTALPAGSTGYIGDKKKNMSQSAIIYDEASNYPGKEGMSLTINDGTFIGVVHSLEVLSNEEEPRVYVNGGNFTPAYPEI